MLFFALAFTPLGTFVFQHRLVIACLFCVKTVIHVALAFFVTVGSYALALLAMVDTYANSQPLADAMYGLGFALATLLAVGGGAMVAPRRLTPIFMLAAAGSAAMFPAWLYVQHGLAGDWRTAFLWYLAASMGGAIAALRLIARVDRHDRIDSEARAA